MTETTSLWIGLLKAGGSLVLVLGLLLAVLYLMRRLSAGTGVRGRMNEITVLATRFVAPKERIVLVEVEGRKLLLGVTAQQINTLAEFRAESGQTPQARFETLMAAGMSTETGMPEKDMSP